MARYPMGRAPAGGVAAPAPSPRRRLLSGPQKLRIERARKLLMSDTNIKAIAAALGFSNSSNFAVAFRRATGETPREYRDRGRPKIVTRGSLS